MTEHWAVWCFRKVCRSKRASHKSNYCCGVTATNTTFRKQIVVRFWIMVPFAKGWLLWFESVSIPGAPDNRTRSNVSVCAQQKHRSKQLSATAQITYIYMCSTNEQSLFFSCSLSLYIKHLDSVVCEVVFLLFVKSVKVYPESGCSYLCSDHK